MYKALENTPRLLINVKLAPLQGKRFQPTGFPDLGAAAFQDAENNTHLLVESAQSVANHLEKVCWDEAKDDLVSVLAGLPYVRAKVKDSPKFTNTIIEPHRLNSPHIVGPPKEQGILGDEILERCEWDGKSAPDIGKLAKYLLYRDPNSLVHGIFFSNLKSGRLRLPRLLSGFIEAENVQEVANGGVKLDPIDAKGEAAQGLGHVPFHRTEYTSEEITAFFNLDLHQLRSFGLSSEAHDFVITLSLFKIRRFLDTDLRLRTACDLEVISEKVKRPEGFTIPKVDELKERLQSHIQKLTQTGEFANPAIHTVGV